MFDDIDCLNERCPYRLSDPPLCKPFGRLVCRVVFRPDSGLPSTTIRYASRGWGTIANLVGFFESLENAARSQGRTDVNPIGFRFLLQLQERTNHRTRARFPVVSAVPLDDPFEFFSRSAPVASEISGPVVVADDPDTIAEDIRGLLGGGE